MKKEPQNLRGISRLARGRRFQKKGYEWGGSNSRPSPWRATDGTILPPVKPSSFAKASDDKPARRPKLSFAERRMVEVAGIRCSASYESQYLFQGFNSRHGGEQAFSLRGGLSPGPSGERKNGGGGNRTRVRETSAKAFYTFSFSFLLTPGASRNKITRCESLTFRRAIQDKTSSLVYWSNSQKTVDEFSMSRPAYYG